MVNLGKVLLEHEEEIIECWYEAYRDSPHPHEEVAEREIKDKLPVQLRVIGEQLMALAGAEDPDQIWKKRERLDPELRVGEGISLGELVLGYKIFVDVVRNWIRRGSYDISFHQFSYFHDAMFELVAEAVDRYVLFQAEAVAQSRSEYLAGVTHQMRSPLAALSYATQIAGQKDPPLDSELAESMMRNIKRLRFLVDGVMRIERFKPHELPVLPAPIEPASIIEDIINDYAPGAFAKGLRLETDIDPRLVMSVDPELFRDALGNLVDNAIKYTPSGVVRIEVEEQENEVTFRVCDSGPGISAERQKELFKPVLPEGGTGVGIGLTVFDRAVAAQGGKVGIESTLGEGTVFWFRLPREVQAKNVRHVFEGGAPSDERGI